MENLLSCLKLLLTVEALKLVLAEELKDGKQTLEKRIQPFRWQQSSIISRKPVNSLDNVPSESGSHINL